MIDEREFRDRWALLTARFGRDPGDIVASAYYEYLSPRLTTESFRAAAQHVFVHREFFPRPVDFVDAVKPDVEAESLAQWEIAQEVMAGDDTATARLSPESRRVIRMLGGYGVLRNTELDRVPFVRREFLQLYGQAAEIARREAQDRLSPSRPAGEIARAAMQGPDAVLALAGRRDDA